MKVSGHKVTSLEELKKGEMMEILRSSNRQKQQLRHRESVATSIEQLFNEFHKIIEQCKQELLV